MATRTAKLRVQVDGEKEYKQAIADLNKGNQVLASEMKKLQAEYKGNESSIEALNRKGDLLQRQLLQQKDKVQTLRDALKNAAQQYGEADKRTQEWQIKLNSAEAAQYDLEHAIEENNEAIKRQGAALDDENRKMVSLGDAVDQVAGKLGIHLPEGARKALDGMQGLSAGSVAAMGAIAAAVAGVIKGIEKLNDLTLEAASRADDLMTKSMVAGVDTKTLQQWQYAAPFIDVSADTIVGALGKVTKAAADGNEAFQQLGVSIYDQNGHLRDSEDLLFESLEALSQYGNETERNAIANQLYGKSYADLNPLILQMDEARRLANEALAEGYVLSEDELRILGETDDAKQKQILTLQKWKDQIAVQWAPTVKAGYELLTKLIDKAGKMLVDSGLVKNFGSLVDSTLALIDSCSDLFDLMPDWLNPINQLSDALAGLSYVMAAIADAANVISGLQIWNWGSGKLSTALGFNYGEGQASNLQRWRMNQQGTLQQYDEFYGNNAGGTQNWRGGLTWVGEAGPELVSLPRGSQIYSNQESRGMGGGTDTSRIEALLARNVELLEEIGGEFSGLRVRRRMA